MESFIFLWAPLKWNFKKSTTTTNQKREIINTNQDGNKQDLKFKIEKTERTLL